MFEFNPPSRTVTLDDIFTVVNFASTYTGPELHTISVGIASDVQDFSAYIIVYLADGSFWYFHPSINQQDGPVDIVTLPFLPGEYTVNVHGSAHGSGRSSEWEKWPQIPVIISDHNVDLGVITLHYIGPMYYEVSGTVKDGEGNGIEGVTITMNKTIAPDQYGSIIKTDDAGAYSYANRGYFTRDDVDVTLTAAKTGWVFDPPSINLTRAYDRTLTLVKFTADFTAIPVTVP